MAVDPVRSLDLEPNNGDKASIAIAVLTYNRAHLLRQCVENVLLPTSSAVREIVIWNNASNDETPKYLDSISDPRFTVIHHPENICNNGFARAFALTSSEYLVTLGDDIIAAPERWDEIMLKSFRQLPNIGFLAADLIDDEHDEAAHLRYRVRPHMYMPIEMNGLRLLRGPTGSGCAMTSRELYDRVGGFRQTRKNKFFLEDEAYIAKIGQLGYDAAILADFKVRHAGGPFYVRPTESKLEFIESKLRQLARRNAIKRVLMRIPLVRRLNARWSWFDPPEVWLWLEEHLREEARGYREALASPDDPAQRKTEASLSASRG